MTRNTYFIYAALCLATLLGACSEMAQKVGGVDRDALVVNELVAANRTGLKAANDSLYDWIEVKNISSSEIALENYALAVPRKKKEGMKTWRFPDRTLQPGETAVVFASKRTAKKDSQEDELEDSQEDSQENETEMHASFKLSSDGGVFYIATASGDTLKKVVYDAMEPDQSYSRQDDGSYIKTYMQTPGQSNDKEGYEQACALLDGQRKDPLRIWEVKPAGSDSGSKWIELRNTSAQDVNLAQYCLATKLGNADKLSLPQQILKAGETFTVKCGKKEGELHLGDARTVLLTKGGRFIDGVCAADVPYGMSIGRVQGQSGFFYFREPTVNSAAVPAHYRFIAPEPTFLPGPGVYSDKKSLTIKLSDHGYRVHYTTDGSEPTMNSPLFKDSLRIDTTTTLRVFCEGDTTSIRSQVATATYFLGVSHSLPVMNITVPNHELYDYNHGIYAEGPGGGGPFPHKGANYWKKGDAWTKKAHVEFYDGDSSFSTDCGLAIFGGFSRAEVKKSFKLKFKDKYGAPHLKYDIYKEGKPRKMKNMVVRSGSQDMKGVMVRDEFFTTLMKENSPALLTQANRPVVLYINGKYFGVYFIREKIDEHFVAHHLGVKKDSVNIIMSVGYNEAGPKTDFMNLLAYARSNDMSNKEAYDHMCSLIDVDGLIDLKLGQIYSGNTDVGNVRYVRSPDSRGDRKWHFVYYDIDQSWTTFKHVSFYLRTSGGASNPGIATHNVLIASMLRSPQFRQRFLERLSMHMRKTFAPQNANRVFDSYISAIRPEMERNCKRWPQLQTYDKWESHVKSFKAVFDTRHTTMLNELKEELHVTPEENRKYFQGL